jgi:transaldolase
MAANPLLALKSLGQSVWLDSIRRGHIRSGDLRRLVENDGLSGETSNPAIFEKAIAGSSDYDEAIAELIGQGKGALEIYETLAVTDVQMAADVFRDVYDKTDGADGFVSLEVSPHLAYDTAGTIAEAQRLWSRVDRPNVMIKIPGTPEGLPAIEECLRQGININITLLFAVARYEEVAWAYVRALERRVAEGQPVKRLASVASFFVSRIDTLADKWIEEKKRAGNPTQAAELTALEGKAAIANAKRAYQRFKAIFRDPRFLALAEKGARVQRPLWASTSTKNPKYRDVLYVETLVGPDTVNTLPFESIEAFRDHGKARVTLEEDLEGSEQMLRRLEDAGISLRAVTDQVLREGVEKFSEPFDKLIKAIGAKQETVAGKAR